MSLFKNSRRALVILGLVGLAATASATQASAFDIFGGHFGGGFGGGHGGGGYGGGHGGSNYGGGYGGGGGRLGGFGFGGIGFGGGRHTGGYGSWGGYSSWGSNGSWGNYDRHPIRPIYPHCYGGAGCGDYPIHVRWPRWPVSPVRDCSWTHSCRSPWLPPVYVQPTPVYVTPRYTPPVRYAAVAPSYTPAPAYVAPVAAPAPAYVPPAPVCAKDPTIWIVFQPTATSTDITGFLKAYNVTMQNGPDASAVYRLRVDAVPQDQLSQLMDSMRTQTNVVSQVGA